MRQAESTPRHFYGRPTERDRDIRLYMLFRLILLFSVIMSLVVYQQSGFLSQDTIIKTYFVTFFTFLVTTGFIFLYDKASDVPYFLISQVAYDILFTTVLIFYTGPFESMYTVFYLFNIVFASIVFPRLGAIFAAIASAVLYGTVAWINFDSSREEHALSVLTTITAFITLSLLASQLVEEIRRSRSRISRLEELSEDIVNSLDSGLLGLDGLNIIRKVNRAAELMLDVKAATDLIGKPLREALPAIGEVSFNEVKELATRGRMRRILLSRVALPENHSMILLRDITDVLDLEERARRQERLAGVGRLATGVAHEIRNPIASISGAAQLLGSLGDDSTERERLMSLIVRESDRVDRLVSSLLRFSRPPQENRDVIRLDVILNECVEAARARSDFKELAVEIVADIQGPIEVRANRDELSEVVTNLIVNSIQAFSGHASSTPKQIKLQAEKGGGEVRVVVTDNGPGIPREYRSRVFDPFFTTKPSGTGLGLAQVHKIVRDHHGYVDLDSEEGRGTSLTIRLPA